MSTQPPLRIAIATSPVLLSESLRTLLSGVGVDVTVLVEPTPERFDVVIGTADDDLPPGDLIVLLDPAPGSRGGGLVRRPDGADVTLLPDVHAVVQFVTTRTEAR